jgi:LacI family transcriptional regulator
MPADETKSTRATIHDVAREAGVSIGTVSRVINGHGRTGAATRERVQTAVDRLGYRVNTLAQSMRRQATRTVALLVHDIGNPVFATAARAAQSVLEEAGYMLVLASSDAAGSEAASIRLLGQRRMDGIIGFPRSENDPATIEALREFDGALVLFDRTMDVQADMVLTDHAGGVSRATNLLLDLGHRWIALVGGASNLYPGRERIRGFLSAFRAYGVEPPPCSFVRADALDSDYAFRETSNLLFGSPRPTAMIAGGNLSLEGMINAIKAAQLSVPDEISLVSFDDSAIARVFVPPITVVVRDVPQMGRMGAKMLLERLRLGRDHPQQKIVLSTQVALRGSCARPPTR